MRLHLHRFPLALIGAFLLAAFPLSAQTEHREFTVTADKVSDGDTANFTVVAGPNAGTKLRVRFAGIDAPEVKHAKHEPGQPFGDDARVFLGSALKGRAIRVVVTDVDRYQRSVCLVYADDRLVNEALVSAGLAHVYRAYLKKLPGAVQTTLVKAEAAAKAERRGLWSQVDPENPADYRRRMKKGGG